MLWVPYCFLCLSWEKPLPEVMSQPQGYQATSTDTLAYLASSFHTDVSVTFGKKAANRISHLDYLILKASMTVLFVYPLVCFVCGHSYSKHIHTMKNLFVHLLPVKHVCVVSNKSAGQVKLSGGRSSGRLLCDSSSPYQDHSRCPLQQA